jgi:hypothetical protein
MGKTRFVLDLGGGAVPRLSIGPVRVVIGLAQLEWPRHCRRRRHGNFGAYSQFAASTSRAVLDLSHSRRRYGKCVLPAAAAAGAVGDQYGPDHARGIPRRSLRAVDRTRICWPS